MKLTKSAQEEIKSTSIQILIGFILQITGLTLSIDTIKEYNIIPLELPPIIYIFGIILSLIPMLVRPEFFFRLGKYLLVIGIGTFIFDISLILLFIMFGIIEILLFLFMGVFASIYAFIRIRKIMNSERIEQGESPKLKDILGAFTRSQKITEEEVSISKEKKICLVCKNKTSRLTYICPECYAIYCVKCSELMSNTENACWVCNAPFDETKPIKIPEEKEEEIRIEKDDQKISTFSKKQLQKKTFSNKFNAFKSKKRS